MQANIIAQYDGGILYTDSLVGQILDGLKMRQLYTPALIIVTSDHGESLGDHGTFDGHGGFWENGLHIPLLVKLPASHPTYEAWRGARLSYRVRAIDIAPTILSLAGLPAPLAFQGGSLLVEGDRTVLAQRMRSLEEGTRALIEGRYKLTAGGLRWQLIDLLADPEELRPIEKARPRLLRKMKNMLSEETRKLQATRRALAGGAGDLSLTLDAATHQQLEALGYRAAEGGPSQQP